MHTRRKGVRCRVTLGWGRQSRVCPQGWHSRCQGWDKEQPLVPVAAESWCPAWAPHEAHTVSPEAPLQASSVPNRSYWPKQYPERKEYFSFHLQQSEYKLSIYNEIKGIFRSTYAMVWKYEFDVWTTSSPCSSHPAWGKCPWGVRSYQGSGRSH